MINIGVTKLKLYLGNKEIKSAYRGNDKIYESTKYYTITYRYGDSVVNTSVVAEGTLVSNYMPPAVSGRTFIGWRRDKNGTSAETLYATGNMLLYGIGQTSSGSWSASAGGDKWDAANQGSEFWAPKNFTASVPMNTTINEKVWVELDSIGSNGGNGRCKNNTFGHEVVVGSEYGSVGVPSRENSFYSDNNSSISYTLSADHVCDDDEWYGVRVNLQLTWPGKTIVG